MFSVKTYKKKQILNYNILNLTCMWLILHLLVWRNLRWVRCNDLACYTQVLAHVFLLINYRMHLSKNKFSLCFPHRKMLRMMDHPIIISVPTRTTNRMQLITYIYVRWDVLLKVKLLHYTIRAIHLNKLKKYMGDN